MSWVIKADDIDDAHQRRLKKIQEFGDQLRKTVDVANSTPSDYDRGYKDGLHAAGEIIANHNRYSTGNDQPNENDEGELAVYDVLRDILAGINDLLEKK